MSTHEHAAQIYAAMIAGWLASGRNLSGYDEGRAWAQTAIQYAKAFGDANKTP